MNLSDWSFWLFVFLCFFLFWGEPDVWDKAHEYTMQILEPKACASEL